MNQVENKEITGGSSKIAKAQPGQYLTFNLRTRPYGVAIETVREINRMGDISPIPGTPAYMAGVINLRGKVIPVVNLRMKFGFTAIDANRETCIIVIDTPDGLVGMIVDSVAEVVTLEKAQIEPSPVLAESEGVRWITGVGKVEEKVILLVDIVGTLSQVTAIVSEETTNAA